MKRRHQVAASLLVLFSAFMAWESLQLKFYTTLGPGPGFFPFWISLLVGFLGCVVFIQATIKPSEPAPEGYLTTKVGSLRVGSVVLSVVFIVAFMNSLGFRLSMLIFYLFLLYSLGRQNLIVTVLVAFAGSFGIYHLFTELLRIPLPIGMFGV